MDLKYFFDRIRDVKLGDYISVIPMAIALLIRPFYKKKYEGTWLVCEEPAEARDNGYHFFSYMCKKQPQQKCYYAIKRKSVDYKKVEKLGSVIEYASIQHWIAYFLCKYNISSQKGGKPNAAMCSFMELNGTFKSQNIFLQHGITKDMAPWLYADKCNFKYFITAAIPEDEMIKKYFNYPDGIVQLTGFPRYDALVDESKGKKQILIMPTWRYWFILKSKRGNDVNSEFANSNYFKKWLELLKSPELESIIDKHNLKVIFFLHRNMQRYIEYFGEINSPITIASWKEHDMQALLKQSSLMITDYSSVYFDMVYMKKPVIFYQFDEDMFRKYQYQKGWFDYRNNPFGKLFSNVSDVLSELELYCTKQFYVAEEFDKRYSAVFKYCDRENSERIFHLLNEVEGE